MKNFKINFLFYCIAILLMQAQKAVSQNLILNGDFETATVGLPGGTSLSSYPTFVNNWAAVNVDGEFIYDATLAHTGTGFLSVLQNTGGNPVAPWLGNAGSGGYDRAIQIINVQPATNYKLQLWLRSGAGLRYPGYDEGTAFIQVEQFAPVSLVMDTFTVYTPANWQQSTFYFTTGSLCTSIALLLSVFDIDAADAWFDDIELTVDESSGLQTNMSANSAVVYPTIFNDQLTIKTSTSGEHTFALFDAMSKIILKQNFINSFTFESKNLAPGIYFYEINNKERNITGKVIKK
jgi:hypothetical protein